jgi:quinol monooxygenase YgiN
MTRSLFFLHARPGGGREVLDVLERLGVLALAGGRPGLLALEAAVCVDDEDDIVILGSWASPAHYERWLASPDHGRLLHDLSELLTTEPETRVYRIAESTS